MWARTRNGGSSVHPQAAAVLWPPKGAGIVGGNSSGASNAAVKEQLVGGRVDHKWQALDPAVIASQGANAFWQKRSVPVVTAK